MHGHRRPSVASAFARRHASLRLAQICALVLIEALCGCGGHQAAAPLVPAATSGPTDSRFNPLTELGAPLRIWNVRHQLDPKSPRTLGPSYGPRLANGLDRFTNVAVDPSNNVYGLVINFEPHTIDTEVLLAVIAELPPDSRLVYNIPEKENECRLIQYQSKALGAVLRQDPAGVILIGLETRTPGRAIPFAANNVTAAVVLASGSLGESHIECP